MQRGVTRQRHGHGTAFNAERRRSSAGQRAARACQGRRGGDAPCVHGQQPPACPAAGMAVFQLLGLYPVRNHR